jgi:hypothetical protein
MRACVRVTVSCSAVTELPEEAQQKLFDDHMVKLREAMAERVSAIYSYTC